MKKIDTKKTMMTLKGDPYVADGQDVTVGHVIAEVLANCQLGGKMKTYVLAQKAYMSDGMEADDADIALIKKAFEDTKAYNGNNILLGQALAEVENAT